MEGVAVVPEGDPGRVLQGFGTAATVAPLVCAGVTWGAHGRLKLWWGTGFWGPTAHWGTHTHKDMLQKVPGGMPSPTLGHIPLRLPQAPWPAPVWSWQMPPCSLVSQLAVRQLPSVFM